MLNLFIHLTLLAPFSSHATMESVLSDICSNHLSDDAQLAGDGERGAAIQWLELHTGQPRGFEEFIADQHLSIHQMRPPESVNQRAQFVLNQWERWQSMRPMQRQLALTLELRKLSVASQSANFLEDLKDLSRINQERLTRQLNDRYPVRTSELKPEWVQLATSIAANFRIGFSLSDSALKMSGFRAPIVSDYELSRFGLTRKFEANRVVRDREYYSDLVDNSATIGLNLLATPSSSQPFNLGAYEAADRLLIDRQFARTYGFFMPKFNSGLELMNIFSVWDPGALTELLDHLRYSLPRSVRNVRSLFLYLDPIRQQELFPPSLAAANLNPLRTRLEQFIMNTDDAEEFLRNAFRLFLLNKWQNNSTSYVETLRRIEHPAGIQSLFSSDFAQFLGFPGGFSLRVPGAVSSALGTIMRAEPLQSSPPFHSLRDSRRLDHRLAP